MLDLKFEVGLGQKGAWPLSLVRFYLGNDCISGRETGIAGKGIQRGFQMFKHSEDLNGGILVTSDL